MSENTIPSFFFFLFSFFLAVPVSFQSLVLISQLPYVTFFHSLLKIMAPEYFEKQEPCLEAGQFDYLSVCNYLCNPVSAPCGPEELTTQSLVHTFTVLSHPSYIQFQHFYFYGTTYQLGSRSAVLRLLSLSDVIVSLVGLLQSLEKPVCCTFNHKTCILYLFSGMSFLSSVQVLRTSRIQQNEISLIWSDLKKMFYLELRNNLRC